MTKYREGSIMARIEKLREESEKYSTSTKRTKKLNAVISHNIHVRIGVLEEIKAMVEDDRNKYTELLFKTGITKREREDIELIRDKLTWLLGTKGAEG